jgi:hypothetical protein
VSVITTYYKCVFFLLEELIPRALFQGLGERAWLLFSTFTLSSLDNIRKVWGKPLVINNWHKGGTYNESGARMLNSLIGAKLSKHKEFIAFDLKPKDPKDHKALYEFLTTTPNLNIVRVEHIDDTPTWIHIEIGLNKGLPKIFKP